jgi:hypothetical protein
MPRRRGPEPPARAVSRAYSNCRPLLAELRRYAVCVTVWYELALDGARGNPDRKHHNFDEAKELGYEMLESGEVESFAIYEIDDRNGIGAAMAMNVVFDSLIAER